MNEGKQQTQTDFEQIKPNLVYGTKFVLIWQGTDGTDRTQGFSDRERDMEKLLRLVLILVKQGTKVEIVPV